MTERQFNFSTSVNLQSDSTHYVFVHDPQNPSIKPLFDWLKKPNGVYYALSGPSETGEPYNAIVDLKKCDNENSIETNYGGMSLMKVLKFNYHSANKSERFNITLECISLNKFSKIDHHAQWCFQDRQKHQRKTIKFVSVCGKNDACFNNISNRLDLLGYQHFKFGEDGYLFYWYDNVAFNCTIKQHMNVLFSVDFIFNKGVCLDHLPDIND